MLSSTTFYEQLLHQFSFKPKLKAHKAAQKRLNKNSCKDNVGEIICRGLFHTHILRAAFLNESVLHSFSLFTIWLSLCFFRQKNINAKSARKT